MDSAIIGLLVLIFFSAFFSGAETALMSLSRLKVMHMVEHKKKNAAILQRLKSNPHRLLVTILIGNNLANIGASALATSLALENFSQFGLSIAIGIMTLVILIFGEITPKSYCIRYAQKISLLVSPLILLFSYIFFPLILSLDFINKIVNRFGPIKKEPMITEEELRTIIKAGEGEGSIEMEESQMISAVLKLNDIEVDAVMTPRPDMFILEWSSKIIDVIPEIIEKGISRIPVFHKRVDKIKGIVHVKDLLRYLANNKGDTTLKEVMQPALFIPESMFINSLLQLFKRKKKHIAMVVDEHGGTQGLVTIEDVLEELVGEIYDESDIPEPLITKINENVVKVLGKADIEDVNESLGLDLEEDGDYETISGYILYILGRIPKQGEELNLENLTIKIDRIEDNRIMEVTITKTEESKESD